MISEFEECIPKAELPVSQPFPSSSSSLGSESEQKSMLLEKSDQAREPEKETPADIDKQVCC